MAITAGQTANASEVLDITKVNQRYTGAAFDSTANSAGGATTTNNYEFSSIASSALINANYLKIEITGSAGMGAKTNYGANVTLQIQTKYIGGAYADSLPTTTFCSLGAGANNSSGSTQTLVWFHTLTANEKSNGVQVKVISASTNGGDGIAGHQSSIVFINVVSTIEVKS